MNDNALSMAVLAVLVLGGLGIGVDHAPPSTRDIPPEEGLRVATYNVHQWHDGLASGRANLHAVRDTLGAIDADVIGLQESDGSRITSNGIDGTRWLAHQLGFHHVSAPDAHAGSYGLALLSRWPIHDVSIHALPTVDTIERHVLIARTGTPEVPLWVAVTHLEIEEHPDVRLRQAEAVTGHLAHLDRLVLLGDFNTPARSDEAAYLLLSGNFTDAWIEAGRNVTAGPTSPLPGPVVRIDHVWLRGHTAVDADTFGGPRASDHRGVWADLRLPRPTV